MEQAKSGDTVRVHYKGLLDDGSMFDTSEGSDPFEFTLGAQMVIPGFENAIVGMDVGSSKTVSISPEDAYGEYVDELVIDVNKDQIPEDIKPEVGLNLQMRADDDSVVNVTITKMDASTVTLDGNHPLAGKALTFEIKLLDIVAA